MLFNSPGFLFVFLPVVALLFFQACRIASTRAAIAVLVAASAFFYAWWNPAFLPLLAGSVVVNYVVGRMLTAARARGAAHAGKVTLVLGVGFNLALLGFFKYAGFFVRTLDQALALNTPVPAIVLPLAISFFTFQQIAYLVDTHRGEAEEYDFLHYCLFVSFFPQLIAGPIVHHGEMLPQFRSPETYRVSVENISVGSTIFLIGLFKKVVVADNFAIVATPVFAAAQAGHDLHLAQAWEGVFAYTVQLYFDFSGYSDMAIGLARLFGIRLPLNFDSPYKAVNVIDFWRRWHMTLSRFLRDYLYIPLGGNRSGSARRYANLMTVMLLGGLWHGAGWTFVFWGGLHGLYLVVNNLWRHLHPRPVRRWWSVAIARSITLGCVMLAWIFFRAESFDGALGVLRGFTNLPHTLTVRAGPFADTLRSFGVRFDGPGVSEGDVRTLAWTVLCVALLWTLPNTQELLARFGPAFDSPSSHAGPADAARLRWRPTRGWGLAIGCMAALAFLSLSRVSEFLYFQF